MHTTPILCPAFCQARTSGPDVACQPRPAPYQKTDDPSKKKKIKELDTKRYNVELSGEIVTVSSSGAAGAVRPLEKSRVPCMSSHGALAFLSFP